MSRDGLTWISVSNAKTYKNLRMPETELRWKDFVEKNPEFHSVDVDNVDFSEVRILLGAELEEQLLPLEEPGARISKDGVLAYKTALGWTIGGRLDAILGSDKCLLTLDIGYKQEVLNQVLTELQRFNDMEAIAIEPRKVKLARAEIQDQEELEKNTTWKDGKITTGMLWKGKFAHVPLSSEVTAKKRLIWLHQRLAKQNLLEKYQATIQTDVAKGYIRKLSAKEAEELRAGIYWCIPHFVVFHPDKPDRPRRVLDCAAKTHGVSLNSFLRSGPNNLADLWGVLQRFRTHKYVIEADITEMFSQVLVTPEDQKMLTFLWNDKPAEQPDLYVNTRHIFGAKCSPAIAVNAVHVAVARMFPHLLKLAIKSFYMDDFFYGASTAEEVVSTAKQVAQALAASGFCLKKWASNNKGILKAFLPEDLAPPFRDITDSKEEPLPILKALGLRWMPMKIHWASVLGSRWSPQGTSPKPSVRLLPFLIC